MRATICLFLALSFSFLGCPGKGRRGPSQKMAENWLVSYVDDVKIGYSVYRQDRFPGGYRFENLIRMKVAMAGKEQEVRYFSEVITGPDFVLQSLEFVFQSQERSLKVSGTVQGNELTVQGQGDRPRTIPLEGPVYPMAALGRLVMSRNPAPESAYRFRVFDATVMAVVPVEVLVVRRERIKVGDEVVEGLKVKTRVAQLEMTSWLDEDGMVLAEVSPPKMRSERTTPERAMAAESGQARLDLLRMFRVPVDTVVPNPAAVRRARLEVSGVGSREFGFEGPGQQVTSQEPLIVEVTVPPVPARVELPISGQAEHLKSSLTIQCDNPQIKAKALEAVGEARDAVAAARKLVSWVFTVLAKEPTASFPTALDVLENMKGDCNEHAVFYAALARSLGIPTKVAVGLVFMDGAFYYHAWNEVYLGAWVPVDATFGEFPAGALHLRLSEGDLSEQAQVLAVVGKIGLRILEYGE